MYPARFPSKIFDIFFSKITLKGVFFDPFAGSGSLAIACYLTCRDFIVWDLNPAIHVIVDASIKLIDGASIGKVKDLIEVAARYGKPWLPEGAEKWWPQQFLDIIGRIWGYFRDNLAQFNLAKMVFNPLDELWSLFATASLYASRKVSFTDDSIPKWFRSKFKRWRLEKLSSSIKDPDDARRVFIFYGEKKLSTFARIQSSVVKPACKPKIMEIAIVDAVKASNYPENVAGVLTSPPYLQAQEYIRSFNWELKLLGVPYHIVVMLKHLEVPYRPPSNLEVLSETYKELLSSIEDPRLRRVVESYFTNTLLVLEKASNSLAREGVMGVFVGDATVRGRIVPIIKIFKEHLTQKLGLITMENEEIDDEIKRRRIFTKRRKNANPNGIAVEHLVFFKKTLVST